MFVTNTFAWHVGAVALFSFAVGASVYRSAALVYNTFIDTSLGSGGLRTFRNRNRIEKRI